jgi:hypothetical protein
MEGEGSGDEGKNDFNPEEEIGIVSTAKVIITNQDRFTSCRGQIW